ncbi:MAG: NAD-dependent epimerase/dehydratase family protein [Candidatus Aenigmarchaeota archaeon]|nr:NAD-dependent epimerase/dehydratase family protein [Candidatus Aenigmarchaeota archaeon]
MYEVLVTGATGFIGSNLTKELVKNQTFVERLLNGSDFPFPVASPYFFLKIPIKRRWELNKIKNPLTKDYEIKKALGVPDSVFNRGYELINK